jgi:hypothetical protein
MYHLHDARLELKCPSRCPQSKNVWLPLLHIPMASHALRWPFKMIVKPRILSYRRKGHENSVTATMTLQPDILISQHPGVNST